MSAGAVALIAEARAERPHAVALATYVSLASLVDPPLLRRARLAFLPPDADAGVEADLWLGPLVESRGPEGITLIPAVREILRARLRGDPARDDDRARLDEAWALTRTMHAHLSPALRMEEEIAWLALRDDAESRARIELLLRSALSAMVGGERRGVAHWAARALDEMPARVRGSESARMIRAGAELRVSGSVRAFVDAGEIPDWLPAVAPGSMPRVPVRVLLHAGAVTLDAGTGTGGATIHAPRTDPLLVELSWRAGPTRDEVVTRQVTFRVGETRTLALPPEAVRAGVTLRTVLGEEYDLLPAGRLGPPALEAERIDFGAELDAHAPFFGRVRELEALRGAVRRASDSGGWIELRGEAGIGKSAVLAEVVRRAPTWGMTVVPHFFVWGEPALLDLRRAERSLAAGAALALGRHEIAGEEPLRGLLAPDGDATRPSLLFVLDGIEDADAASEWAILATFPDPLPPGVVVLYSRAAAPGSGTLRDSAQVVELGPDVDAAAQRIDARANGRLLEFARPLAEAVGGRVDLGVTVTELLGAGDADSFAFYLLGEGRTRGVLEALWERIVHSPVDESAEELHSRLKGLSMSAVAREPTAGELASYDAIRALHEVTADGRVTLRGAATRSFVLSRLHEDAERDAHGDAALVLGTRAASGPPEPTADVLTPYGVRHAVAHLLAADRADAARRLCTSADFMARKIEEVGLHALEQDLLRVRLAAPPSVDQRPSPGNHVLIGGTADDLRDYRRAARAVLERVGFEPVMFERFPLSADAWRDSVADGVGRADVYVVIVGNQYGPDVSGVGKSATELEYELAAERGLPMLVFLTGPDAAVAGPRGRDEAVRIERFRSRLRAERTVVTIGSPDELRARLAEALSALRSNA